MTVTVIIIIAVIVVLAVLVLLLLGMRALSLGSRDDDYEYDDVQDDHDDRRDRDRGRGRDRDDDPEDDEDESRSRGRRSRQGGGRTERRPKARRQRGADWEDDSDGLSDNDFWSSLSDDASARPGPRERDAFGVGDADDHVEEHDDHGAGRGGPIEQTPPGGIRPALPSDSKDTSSGLRPPPGSTSDLAMLASLGQNSTPVGPPEPSPEPERRPAALDPGPIRSALPPTQGLPPSRPTVAATPTPQEDDPLGSGSWSSRPPSTGDPFEGREPLSPEERSGVLNSGHPLYEGGTGYDVGGFHSSDRFSASMGGSNDPLDPGFRPGQTSGADPGSPIWSSMDTGAHQRPDLSGYGHTNPGGAGSSGGFGGPSGTGAMPAPGQPMGSPSVPGHNVSGTDPLSGGHPSGAYSGMPYDPNTNSTDSFNRSEFDTGSHQRSPYDSGTHTRPSHQSSLGDPTRYDTGQHTRPAYDTDSFNRPEYDTGTHQRSPYDSGTHTRPSHQSSLGDPTRYDVPGLPGGPTIPGGPGVPGNPSAPNPALWENPQGSGAYDAPVRPVPGSGTSGGMGVPGQPMGGHSTDPGQGTGAYRSGRLGGGAPYGERPPQTDPFGRPLGRGGPQGPAAPGVPGGQGGPSHPGNQGGYSDMLGGDFPPADYGYPPAQDWRPGEEPGEGPRHGGNAPWPGQGPYEQDHRPGYGQEYYEGGYEDGQYR